MVWSILISAIGLVFVFEGVLPFLSPHIWRRFILQVLCQNDHALRVMGLISMLIGLTIVTVVHNLF